MGESESKTAKQNAGANPAFRIFLDTSALPEWKCHFSEETRHLKLLVDTTEKYLSEQFNKFVRDLAATTKDMNEEAKFETYEFASEHCSTLEHDLPRILRYSLLVHACSLLESTLQGIADCFCQEQNLLLSPKDLTDKGIHRAKKYLTKVAQVPFPEHEGCWQDIATVSIIRNTVVHQNGSLNGDHKENSNIQAFMKKHVTCFDNVEAGRLHFTDKFIPFVIERHQQFFDVLFRGFGC